MARTKLAAMLAAAVAFGLGACGEQPAQEYEADVVDQSGGEMIVEDADAEGVEVDLPETPMTAVPEGEAAPAE